MKKHVINYLLITTFALFSLFVGCKKNNNEDSNGSNGSENNSKWVQKTNYPGAAVWGAVAFSINGKVYVGMGKGRNNIPKNDLWEYDPITNKWTEKSDFPSMVYSFQFNITYFVANNKAYVIGHDNGYKMFEYNPANDNWTQKANCPTTPMRGIGINNKGYVVAVGVYGANDNQRTYEYDPTTDIWKQCADFPVGGLYCYSASAATAATEQNGFLIGGGAWNREGVFSGYMGGIKDVWVYNPVTNKWTQKADFPMPFGNGIAFCKEGIIYAGFGVVSYDNYYGASASKGIYKYDSENNSWSLVTEFEGGGRSGAIAVVCNGKLYVGLGGYGNNRGELLLDFWEYSF